MKKDYDIIILSGGFDPLHEGHLQMFASAHCKASEVVVGVNSDDWLCRKKGAPLLSLKTRIMTLAAIQWVDTVISFDDTDGTAVSLIKEIRECGANYRIAFGNGGDRTDTNTPEKEYCEKTNIELLWNLGGGKLNSSRDIIGDYIRSGGRFGDKYEKNALII